MAARTLVFDVNETLLDMSALDPAFQAAFGSAAARQLWFLTLQGVWMTATLTRAYQPFDKLALAALEMTAARHSRQVLRSQIDTILDAMKTLPPHNDVGPGLAQLHELGFRLIALTNNTRKGLITQLRHAQLIDAFDALFAAEDVKAYKPAAKPYVFAAKRVKTRPRNLHFVSAHAWDIAGAHAAGLRTIFVRRPGKTLNPIDPRPDIEVTDLMELARNIARRRSERRRRA
jgi:2-haloacid dehalogenase